MITITFPEWVAWGIGLVCALHIGLIVMRAWAAKHMADSFAERLASTSDAEILAILKRGGK